MTLPICTSCGEQTDMLFHGLCRRCIVDDVADPSEGLCDCHGKPHEECPFNFDCGMMPDGTCMLAGTEDCDWECPR